MEAVTPLDERTLREQLAREREKLDDLVAQARAVDGELDALAGERQQHKLLHEACGALEALADLGGAPLFWGQRADGAAAAEHLREVRGRMDGFEKRVAEIEDRREALLDEIDQQERSAWFVEEDILEAQEQEARRAEEWQIEREVEAFPFQALILPWTRRDAEDRLFRKSLAISFALSLFLALVSPLIPLPMPDLSRPIEPQRLTYLIPPKPRTPPPLAQPEPKPLQARQEPEKPALAEKAAPKTGVQEAPEEAPGKKGLLAFREQLAGVAEDKAVARLGSRAIIDHAGEAANGPPERSLVTTRASGSSGGVNLSALSRGIGGERGQQLEGVQIARATSSIGSGSGGTGRPVGGDGLPPGRTDEEIQIVFDRHKAALYRLYNRELRNDSSLKGQMILRLTIEPDGRVSMCVLHGTDMKAPQLAAEVVEHVKTFDFGAKEGITAVTILYPIDFLPAT